MIQYENSAYMAYSTTKASNSNEDLLIMLFEGALKFIRLARIAIEKKIINKKGEYISKAMAIFIELDCALDHKNGGEISSNLSSLYSYMMKRLTHANINNDPSVLYEVESLLATVRDGFNGIKGKQHTVISPKEKDERINLAV
jgi:flagellar protein FliS